MRSLFFRKPSSHLKHSTFIAEKRALKFTSVAASQGCAGPIQIKDTGDLHKKSGASVAVDCSRPLPVIESISLFTVRVAVTVSHPVFSAGFFMVSMIFGKPFRM
jgi:hypothetical protein